MFPWLLALAFAGEPEVSKGDDDWVSGHVDIAAAPEAVFAVVSDPAAVASFDDTTAVEIAADGACVNVLTRIEHPIAKAAYRSRSCPDGPLAVKQVLVDGDMKAFESRFQVEPRGDGSRLLYRVRTVPALPVPQFVVNGASARQSKALLDRIRTHLESAGSPD